MARTSRCASLRPKGKTSLNNKLRKNGAGAHNWGRLEDEVDLQFAGIDDAQYELEEELQDGSEDETELAQYIKTPAIPRFLGLSEEEIEIVWRLSTYGFRDEDSAVHKPPPVDSLPLELLSDIFALVVPPQTPTSATIPVIFRPNSEPARLDAPWVFGQVCWKWRALAISMSSLWTKITVASTIVPRQLPLLFTQLLRSGTAPLDVLIRFTSNPRRGSRPRPRRRRARAGRITSDETFYTFLRTLVSHSDRWRTLHVCFRGSPAPPELPALAPRSLDTLEALTFTGYERSALKFLKLSAPTPALQRVTLAYLGMEIVSHLKLPLAQLTTYKASCKPSIHMRHLAAMPGLVECDITSWSGRETYRGAVVTLPRLRRLAIQDPEFLVHIAAPALQSLYVQGDTENVLPFLERSYCTETLTELVLVLGRYYAYNEEESWVAGIISLLQHTRGLTALAINTRGVPPAEIVAALALTGSERICPNLESLSWADLCDDLDRTAFTDMAASRCAGEGQHFVNSSSDEQAGSVLHSVAIYAGRRRMKGEGLRLRALPGLDVVIMNKKKGGPVVAGWRRY
ncbi:hypothetical protein DFH06DRAFT_1343511 [Mycena polygramma]|nr:hypothetical protein DFH06DRAFT_1343511 [Mycena polygramma]